MTLVRSAAAFCLTCLAGTSIAATLEISPGDDFEQAVESLQPGDTLIVHAGDYSTSGRISVGVQGTAASPVVIKGADGEAPPHIRRPASAAAQNTINIEGARNLTLSRLEISSNGGDGVNLNGNPAFITIDQLDIHDIDVGVNFRSSMDNITVRRTHIYRTGGGDGGGTGEGMYVGCNDATCIVRNSLIENNWIHDTRVSTQGDGIEIKLGSHSNIIRDNVIYNTGYPCILLYGTAPNPVNLVEGNVLWGCGDSGIQAAADAVIRNNIIIESPGSNGFNSQPHQAAVPQNLQFVHNTIVGGSPCVRLSNWSGRPGLVFANNAIYCDSDDFAIAGLSGVTVAGNVFVPATSSFPSSGYRVGQSTALDLVNLAGRDVYPTAGSRLIDAGVAAHAAAVDFNGQPRGATPDAGAYERSSATNPGWAVGPGFKNAGPRLLAVDLSATPISVSPQGTTTLTWSSTDATACTASGGWSGAKATSGSEQRGPLAATTTFTLSCSNATGSANRSVTVTVSTAPSAPTVSFSADPNTVAPGGRSTLTWSSTNATGCTASGAWAGNKATSGSEQTPVLNATSNFTLDCTGAGGTTQRFVTVTVNSAPVAPVVTLTANPTSVSTNTSSTLTWSSTNATSCTASGAWSGSKATSGSQSTDALSNTSTYTLQCTGAGGSASQSVTVTVTPGGGTGGGSASGGGSFGWLTLGLLALLSASRSRRAREFESSIFAARVRMTSAWLVVALLSATAMPVQAQIVEARIRSTGTASQTDVPATFGQVFKAGDVPSGAVLSATLDGAVVPLQVDVKARHADGSLRHALLTATVPSLSAGAVRVLSIGNSGTTPGGAAVSASDVLATAFDAVVTADIGGVPYTASARSLLSSGPVQAWMSGALASEWVVSGPVRRADGTAHPHLAARFEIRAYSGVQRIRVSVTLENNWAFAASPQRYTYNLTVSVNGKGNVLASTGLVHYRQSRWRRVFWWGTEPLVDVQHDTRYMMSTGAVPAYEVLTVPNGTLNGMVSDFAGADDLMQVGNLTADMPAGGGRWEIAPLPGFAARYIVSEDPRAKLVTVGHGEQAGTWPMHYRDQQTGLPLSLDNSPNASIMDGSDLYGTFPSCGGNCSVPYTPEVSHHPSLAFVPYLITGDYYFLEELQFWASWVLMYGGVSSHGGAQGLIVWDQTRGQAWGLRTIGQAAYATPDAHPLKSYFVNKLANNLAYYNANWLDSNPLGYITLTGPMSGLGLQRWISTWMDDFLTWSFGYLTQLGFTEARAMRDWKSKFPVGRMTDPDMCWILASTYWPTVMDNNYLGGTGQPVRTWADWRRIIILGWDNDAIPADGRGNLPGQLTNLLNASCNSPQMSAALGLPQNWMMGYGGQPDGYPANLQPALATAADAGVPNAALAWTTFRNADSYPDYSSDPQWAVVPMSAVAAVPSLTLTANPATVTTGGSSTLNWAATNATSCVASGGWSGNKALSGMQSVGPLSQTSSFTLDCSNSAGSISRSTTVTVGAVPAAPTVNLAANPTSVVSSGTSTLTWSSTNATSCTASGAWSGARATSGSQMTGALTVTSTFTLGCTGAGGTTNRSVTVTVSAAPPPPAAPTVSLSANPTSVAPGSASTLTWSSTNATSCTASDGWSGSKATSGSESTGALSTSATYSLSCTSAGGSASASAAVTVTAGGGGGGGGGSGGGGSLGYFTLLWLALYAVWRQRRYYEARRT